MRISSTIVVATLAATFATPTFAATDEDVRAALEEARTLPATLAGKCDGGNTTVTLRQGKRYHIYTGTAERANVKEYKFHILFAASDEKAYAQEVNGVITVLPDASAFAEAAKIRMPQFGLSAQGLGASDCVRAN